MLGVYSFRCYRGWVFLRDALHAKLYRLWRSPLFPQLPLTLCVFRVRSKKGGKGGGMVAPYFRVYPLSRCCSPLGCPAWRQTVLLVICEQYDALVREQEQEEEQEQEKDKSRSKSKSKNESRSNSKCRSKSTSKTSSKS